MQITKSKRAMNLTLHRDLLTIVTVTKDNFSDLCLTFESMSAAGFQGQHVVMDASRTSVIEDDLPTHDWRLDYVFSKDNGPFDGMNRALHRIAGKYVLFLNAGDRLMPQVDLDFLIWRLETHERSRWLVGRSMSTRGNKWVGPWPHPSFSKIWRTLGVQSWNHQSTIFETAFLIENGGFLGTQITADWSTALKLERLSKPLLHGGYIALFDVSGVSSRLSGRAWIADHVSSWRSVSPAQSIFDWSWFFVGYALLKIARFRNANFFRALDGRIRFFVSIRTLLNKVPNFVLGTGLFQSGLKYASTHNTIRRFLLFWIRFLGLSRISDRLLEKVQNSEALASSSADRSELVSFSELARTVSLQEKSNVRFSLFVDDIICELAPNRGIEKFWLNVLKELQGFKDIRVVILSATGRFDSFADEVIPIPINLSRQTEKILGLLDEYIPDEISGVKNIFLSTYYNTSKVHTNLTIVHDLIPEVFGFPNTGIWAKRTQAFETSQLLVSLSENTFQDFQKFHPLEIHKLHSVTMGVDSSIFNPRSKHRVDEVRKKFGIPDTQFLLYVGARELYKSGAELLTLAKSDSWTHNIVFVGGEPVEPMEHIFQVFPDDEDLAALFSGAEATVVTSNYEGFGMPALESSACGTPVICKNNSSLFEATLGRGVFLEKFNSPEFSKALEEARKFKAGGTQVVRLEIDARKRTWLNTAHQLIQILDQHDFS